jgi:hypothetical protein
MRKSKNEVMLELRRYMPICKSPGCHEQVFTLPDSEQPSVAYYRPWGEGGTILSTISPPMKRHESGLCYYHLKKDENYFDCRFPIKPGDRVSTFSEGGLSLVKSPLSKLQSLFNK